ncbi:TonB-dependent receptor domain-containing protein [Tahibacter amnicola]|uniref:TonB-dependent receptor n=1 Tax=Tahibacter amnicola TaxID=2976241 RepID=A0ABY6BBS8_9GAMM|nr:TonB-dependent receptor [Tahibacter amnicola]UXI66613.1 TonB-dependent receptor [Tahibacter amnicola]
MSYGFLRQRPLPLMVAFVLSQGAMAASALSEEAEEKLDPVLVTADRGPDTNTVVRPNRIDVELASSLRDLFKQTPEVNVAGGLPVAQKLYVRGIAERMLTVTIDGAAQPESAYHHTGQVMVEPELLKRVEIEAGTAAATAGPGALAGALRFTTKTADDLLRPGRDFGVLAKGSYFGNSDGRKVSSAVYGHLGENLGLVASASRLDADDYRGGDGKTVPNSAIDARNAFIKLNGDWEGGHAFALAVEGNEDEGLRNKRTNLGPAPFNPAQRQRTQRESATFNYDYAPGNALLNLHAVAYANDNAVRLDIGQPAGERHGTRSHGVNLSNVSTVGVHQIAYGIDYRQDVGYSDVSGAMLPDDRARVAGTYLQDDMTFAERWLVGIGARYDRYTYRDPAQQRFAANGFSPGASIGVRLSPEWTVRLSHARALRGVGVVEPFLKQHQDNAAHIDPEKARNTEAVLQWQRDGWRATAGVFRQRIDDYIGYDEVRDNLGDVRVKGYNASIGFQQDALSVSLGVAHARPELNGEPLADDSALLLGNATGHTWVAQVDYAVPSHGLTFGWTGRMVEELDFVPAGARTKPGYAVHDAYVQWHPQADGPLRVTLTAKNLFDRHFYDQGSFGYHPRWGDIAGLPEPGRDIRLGVAYDF